jgi:glycosyltransferase involved in cell wall biosynthesis/tetratricopeptide (TPR) repeat protein
LSEVKRVSAGSGIAQLKLSRAAVARVLIWRAVLRSRRWFLARVTIFGSRKPADPLIRSISLYRQGKGHYVAKDFARAKAVFEEVVALVPTNGGAWYYLARIDWMTGNHADSVPKFEKAAEFSPDNPNAAVWLDRARIRLAKIANPRKGIGASTPARPAPEVVAEEDTDVDASVLDPLADFDPLTMARRLLAQDAAADALALCQGLLNDPELHYDARRVMARACLHQSDPVAAIRHFTAVLDDAALPMPVLADYAHTLLTLARTGQGITKQFLPGGDYRRLVDLAIRLEGAGEVQAGVALRRTLWIHTGKFDHARDCATTLAQAGRARDAVEFLQELREEIPFNKSVYLLQADLCMAQNWMVDAKRVLLDGRRELPDEPAILTKLAKLLAGNGRWDEAIKIWAEVVDAAPNMPGIRVEIADCYRRGAQYERAAKEYRVALRREPRNEKAFRGLAQSLRRLGRQHEAISVMRELVQLAPGNFDNWNELIYSLARAEIADEAVATLEAAADTLGHDLATIRRLALSAERALLWDEAEDLLKRVVSEQSNSGESIAELGRHYLRQGYISRADTAFQTAIEHGLSPSVVVHEVQQIAHIRRLLGATGPDVQLQIPEDIIKFIADRRGQFPAQPAIPGRVSIVTTKLASGGAERQTTITAASLCARTDYIESVALHCLSLSSERGHDFYLPLIKDLPIDVTEPSVASLEDALELPEVAEYADLIGMLPAELAFMVAVWAAEFSRRRPEVVHAWQDSAAIGGAIAAIIAGVPRVVLSTRNTRPDNKYRRWKRYMWDAYNAFHARGIVLSNNSRAGGTDYDDWLDLPIGTTQIVYNGVDFSRLDLDRDAASPAEIKARLGIPLDAPIMGGVFRLSGEKQPLLWVETAALVAKRFPNMHFVICGQGTMRNDILALSAKLGIADRLHLPGNQRPIAPWYRAMDIFLLSSRKEGLPNVLLESQFLNVPVVSTNVGGVSEVMDLGVSGWWVEEQDAEVLAERVIFSLENKEWYANACQAGRAFVSRTFSLETMCNRTLQVYGYGPDAAVFPEVDAVNFVV